MIEPTDAKKVNDPELLFALEYTKSISWRIFLDTDTLVFSDNFETRYGIHQSDYSYRFGIFLDRHLNPHKEQILESIDLYFSGEADNVAIGEITIFDDKHKLNWLQANGKCIYENRNVIYGVSVDITEIKVLGELLELEQKKNESGYRLRMPKLTKREQDVINALLDGNFCHKDLSVALCISPNTVKTHLKRIYQAVGVTNIPALLSYLHSSGITTDIKH